MSNLLAWHSAKKKLKTEIIIHHPVVDLSTSPLRFVPQLSFFRWNIIGIWCWSEFSTSTFFLQLPFSSIPSPPNHWKIKSMTFWFIFSFAETEKIFHGYKGKLFPWKQKHFFLVDIFLQLSYKDLLTDACFHYRSWHTYLLVSSTCPELRFLLSLRKSTKEFILIFTSDAG